MKALELVRHGEAARAYALRTLPDPVPGPGQVRITVEASGVNFADILARKGLYKDAPRLPYIPGFDVVGVIDAVGANVHHLRPGMHCVALTRFGGYASKAIARTEGVAEVSRGLDAATAAALGTQCCTAWYMAAELVRLHPGDLIIVRSAAGGVGSAIVQIAKASGCVVCGTTGTSSKVETLRSIGVDYPICTAEPGFASRFLAHFRGRKADVIFDACGGSNVRDELKLLAGGGRLICYGASELSGPGTQVWRTLRTLLGFGLLPPVSLLVNSTGIIGVNMLRIADERPDIIQRCLTAVIDLARSGTLRPPEGISLPVSEVASAHELLESRRSLGKIVLTWREIEREG